MVVKVIVFDFDGTIADTHGTIVAITNSFSGDFGFEPVSEEELLRLRSLSSRELLKQAQISLFKIPFLIKKVQGELRKEMTNLEPIAGMRECLFELKAQGYQLGIITSNVKENVVKFLEVKELNNLFDFIYSGTTLFGKHKVINKFLKQHNLNPDEAIYVGDETRDIEAAKKSKIKIIAVGWGFNLPSILRQHEPDFFIEKPQEILKVVLGEAKN
ncbi:MAG: HAD-IA family hydrolase [Gomphosphaeria aponina SAG 52.96 = DSM 107014]|uniref:HAD-IA family hydrolase n=1 Tax=Gomphosphaeria aponina SAG 52.96 = DSM 107014 TaxID=1521640 RepID=A0A941JRA7_9CHRO|nr:HAD-IA family hydrolase [Gomphosphaeria aponina SAG 52.96 = DSM 107014]